MQKDNQEEYDDYDDRSGGDSDEPATQEYYETSMLKTIKECSDYVAAITRDLESQEKAYIDALKEEGKKTPKPIWADATFTINFVTSLIDKFFGNRLDRLMKYYIIFLLPLKPWIVAREEKFFLKANIFPGAPEADIKFFRDLWAIDGTMTDFEKNTIWNFWDVQIEIAEDWKEITGWVVNPNEKLNIPNIDYAGEANRLGLSVPKISKK